MKYLVIYKGLALWNVIITSHTPAHLVLMDDVLKASDFYCRLDEIDSIRNQFNIT